MAESNPNYRLETFSDGVFAIALTLLIIDIKIPATPEINNNADFWLALRHIAPSLLSFVLSFAIILITWVNHHNAFKLIKSSTTAFIFANGFLLLTVVFLPFPTSLVGEYLFTDHAGPAVVLYDLTTAMQAVGWILMCTVTIKDQLGKNERAYYESRRNRKFGFYSLFGYTFLSILAIWFPLTIAVITLLLWVYWLIHGMSLKDVEA